ncbi:MAG: hypothetical protein GWN14_02175 [candidate division Zixibacteria bacterium]|nr:hypothetical protein [candidate division Zixibacteria bacterium]
MLTPLRDPVKSIISREQRHPELSHEFIPEAFSKLHRLNAVFLPIDSDRDRAEVLETALKGLGLRGNEVFQDWPVFNTRGGYQMKLDYEAGIVPNMPEVDLLVEESKTIIPFLKSQGYKYMPWWDLCK